MIGFKCYLLLFSVSFLIIPAFSQEGKDPDRRIGLHTGYSHYLINDEIGSNLNYSGSSIPIILNYRVSGNKRLQEILLSFDRADLSNPFNENDVAGIFMSLAYSHTRLLPRAKILGADLFIGGAASLKGSQKVYEIGITDQTTAEVIFTLDFKNWLIRSVSDKQIVVIGTDLSLFSYAFTREFVGSFTHDILLPGKILDFNFQISYIHSLTKIINAQLLYNFDYWELNRINDIQLGRHQLLAGMIFRL